YPQGEPKSARTSDVRRIDIRGHFGGQTSHADIHGPREVPQCHDVKSEGPLPTALDCGILMFRWSEIEVASGRVVGGQRLHQVQPAVAHVGAYRHRVSHGSSGLGLVRTGPLI